MQEGSVERRALRLIAAGEKRPRHPHSRASDGGLIREGSDRAACLWGASSRSDRVSGPVPLDETFER